MAGWLAGWLRWLHGGVAIWLGWLGFPSGALLLPPSAAISDKTDKTCKGDDPNIITDFEPRGVVIQM